MLSDQALDVVDGGGYLLYKNDVGRFFAYNAETKVVACFNQCRTEFALYWPGGTRGLGTAAPAFNKMTDHIGYHRSELIDIGAVSQRWEEIEATLNIEPRSVFYPTQHKTAIVMKVSPFWLANDTVRSFLTLFLRGIICFPASTLMGSMKAYPVSEPILPAIRWFMEGNTKPTYDKMTRTRPGDEYVGVVNEMWGLNGLALAAKLVKP